MTEKASLATTTSSMPLKLVEPRILLEHMNEVYDSIARRAFELFQNEGGILGRDLDHWFKAEEEMLHPVHVDIHESADTVSVQAEVPGFGADDLKLSLEPWRLTISGKKSSRQDRKEGKAVYHECCSNEILRVINLPAEVNPNHANATLKNGVLKLTMNKAAQSKATPVVVKAALGS